MPSNNSKNTEEMRTQTAEFILSSGKSATSVAKEMGINTNTVCRWVRDYRRKNKMGTYAEEKGFLTAKPTSTLEIKRRCVIWKEKTNASTRNWKRKGLRLKS